MYNRCHKLGKPEKKLSDDLRPHVQGCLKCLRHENFIILFVIGLHIYILIFLFVFSCSPGGDQFYVVNGEKYEFVQQMRRTLALHETVYANNYHHEERYEAPPESINPKTKLRIRKSPVKITYENGDIKDCNLFDSMVRTSGFILMCDHKTIRLNDWGEYNMVFEDQEKCFQANLYTRQKEKIHLETREQCTTIYQIFERHTAAAHVKMNVKTLTNQGYNLATEKATSIVLRYHSSNPARWVLQEVYQKPSHNENQKNTKKKKKKNDTFVLYETSVVDLEIYSKDSANLQRPESCLGITFSTARTIDNSKKKFYVEMTEQCAAIERLYKQTQKDISRSYNFHELIEVESSTSETNYNGPTIFRTASFVFNFDEEKGTPMIYFSNDNNLYTKVDLDIVAFEDLRTHKFEDKYCYKMVIKAGGFGFATLYLETFCEQFFVDTTYSRKN